MNLSSHQSQNNLTSIQGRTSASHSEVSANRKNARQSSKQKANGLLKTNRRSVKSIRSNRDVDNAAAASEPASQQSLKDAIKQPVKQRKCQQEKTLHSGAILSAYIVPPSPETNPLFRFYGTMFDVLVSESDLRCLIGENEHKCIYINGKPFTAMGCAQLKRGQIVIPEIFKDDFQHIIHEDRTVELSAIPKEKIPEFNEIEVIIKNKDAQLLEDDQGNRLFLDIHTLQRCINDISRNGYIFDTTREYPVNIVVAKPKPKPERYPNRVVLAQQKTFLLSVRPTAAALYGKAYGDPGKHSEEQGNKEKKQGYTLEDFEKMNFFIYNSRKQSINSIVPNDGHSDILLIDKNTCIDKVEKTICFEKTYEMDGENILNFPFHSLKDGKRAIVEIDGYYYYADQFTNVLAVSGNCNHYVNNSFHNCHAENKPLLTTVHTDKTFKPAKNVIVELNWLLNDRRKVPLVGEAMKQKIRSVLNDVPLQKGRYFQVLIELDIAIYDDTDKVKRLKNRKPAVTNNFVLEGKVVSVEGVSVEGNCPGKTTSVDCIDCIDCSPEEAFRIDDKTDLTIQAKDKSILDGSEPNYWAVEPYLPVLTDGLIGMESYAKRIVETIIIPRKLYELGLSKTYNKGVIIHGLPGNGKSVLASRILKSFNISEHNKHIVTPGQLIGSTAEETAKNFHALFEEAKNTVENTASHNIPALRIFLFDEFDWLFVAESKLKGRSESQVALIGLFNTLLDSPDAPDNILCIFTTNSDPDTELDSSLTRSGRISLKLEIGNPDDITRKDMIKDAAESLEPLATIDSSTLMQVANYLMNDCNSREIIDTVKAAKEQAMFAGIKQPLKLMIDHFHQVLFHKNDIQKRKTEAMSALNNKDFWTETNYDKEKAKLKSTLTPLTRGFGKACLCFIKANKGARVNKFLYESLAEIDGFTHYLHIDGKAECSPRIALNQLKLGGGERKLIFITNTTEFIRFFGNCRKNPLDFGTAWKKVKENMNTNIALVLVTKHEDQELNLHDLGLDEAEVDSDSLVLPDKFNHQEMKEYLRKTYAKANASTIESLIEVFPDNYPIQDFIRVVNYHCNHEEEATTWNTEEIHKALTNLKFPLKIHSIYT